MGVPCRMTSPDVGVSRPARRPRSVLLPLPDEPMMATNSPGSTSKEMPRRISTVRVPLRMVFVKLLTRMLGTDGTDGITGLVSREMKGKSTLRRVVLHHGARFEGESQNG